MGKRCLELVVWLVIGPGCVLSLAHCATNPATGKRQLALISEAQEIQLGRQSDQGIVEQMGLYPDPELQAYITDLGERMAAASERPGLPWTFRVVDDPVVNAFALPGGFIYITRGIMAHMGAEAQLAGVMGHEIGHVTGRHGVERLSKAQLAGLGLGVGMILSPEFRRYGGMAQQGLGLLFLKFGRDDERQADSLGYRYATRTGYNPYAMAEVFDILGRVSGAAGASRLPGWLSTHPQPENRSATLRQMAAEASPELQQASWLEGPYLDQMDGVVFGNDPRQGFFRDGVFYHPEMAFQLSFPSGWETQNQRQQVVAMSPEGDAAVILSLAEQSSPQDALRAFVAQEGVTDAGRWLGGRLASRSFSAVVQQGTLEGGVAFTGHNGQVFQILGLANEGRWRGRYDSPAGRTAASFRRLRDRRYLDIEPQRLEIVRIQRDMSLEEFSRRYPSSISLEQLALVNNMKPDARLERGQRIKRVVGTNPAEI